MMLRLVVEVDGSAGCVVSLSCGVWGRVPDFGSERASSTTKSSFSQEIGFAGNPSGNVDS